MRYTLILFLILIGAATAAQAQNRSNKPPPGPERGKVFNDWTIDCETPPNAKEQCFATQSQTLQQQGGQNGRLLKLSIGYLGPEGKPAMVAVLPLGLFLPAGVAYQVEGQQQKPMVMQRCVGEGCIAAVELDDAMLGQMRKATKMSIGFKGDATGQTMVIPVSLKGFDAAVKTLK